MKALICPHCKIRGQYESACGPRVTGQGRGGNRISRHYRCSCGERFTTHEEVHAPGRDGKGRKVTPAVSEAIHVLRAHGFSHSKLAKALDIGRNRIGWILNGDVERKKRAERIRKARVRRPEQNKLYRLREQARIEAKERGVPPLQIYQEWGCMLPSDPQTLQQAA